MAQFLKVKVHDKQEDAMIQIWQVNDHEIKVKMQQLHEVKRSRNKGRKHHSS